MVNLDSAEEEVTEHILIHDDTHGIVQKTLAENDGVELWVNLILVENSENGDRISSRKCRSKCQAFQ
jgi:hypothetical protein